jgi:hypothetical protein
MIKRTEVRRSGELAVVPGERELAEAILLAHHGLCYRRAASCAREPACFREYPPVSFLVRADLRDFVVANQLESFHVLR